MSTLDWPAGFGRTPTAAREPHRSFQATLGQTTQALATEMDRLDPDEWRASTASGGRYVKSNGLPKRNANPDDPGFVLRWSKDGEQFAVARDASPRLRDNVRFVYLWVHETRMRSNRPVVTGSDEFAAARLPPGDGEGAVVAGAPSPHEVLGVAPDADESAVRDAFRERVHEVHPDAGGSDDALRRLTRARDRMLRGDDRGE